MEAFLGRLTQQAMNYAIRSGIAITSGYAVQQCSRYLKTVDDRDDFRELQSLQERLDSKIRIISPAIDMIELISARGNTTLESAVTLTKALRWDIQSLGVRLSKAAAAEENTDRKGRKQRRESRDVELRSIIADMKRLLARIEDAVPLINLAITTSGASLSTTLPATVSPSRMLQASTFLTACDTQYSMDPSKPVQVGPTFTLSLYMLFAGHHRHEVGARDMTWKEAIHKAKVRLLRVPLSHLDSNSPRQTRTANNGESVIESIETKHSQLHAEGRSDEYAYSLYITEDLDDGRVHTDEDGEPLLEGIHESFPIHQVSKIFYADTGKILNISPDGETNNPILLLKRDVRAEGPRAMMKRDDQTQLWSPSHDFDANHAGSASEEDAESDTVLSSDTDNDSEGGVEEQLRREASAAYSQPRPQPQSLRLPHDLDPEWVAFEVYQDTADDDDDSSADAEEAQTTDAATDSAYVSAAHTPSMDDTTADLSQLGLASNASTTSTPAKKHHAHFKPPPKDTNNFFGQVRSSLSLLEMLIRLTSLQQFEQASHLSIPDQTLMFFLNDSSTTGAGPDVEARRRTRWEARSKLGFDPYDESPIKHHGEEYQINGGQEFKRGDSAFEGFDDHAPIPGSRHTKSRSATPVSHQKENQQHQWLLRDKQTLHTHQQTTAIHIESSPTASSPLPGSPLPRRNTRPMERGRVNGGLPNPSPLGKTGNSA